MLSAPSKMSATRGVLYASAPSKMSATRGVLYAVCS